MGDIKIIEEIRERMKEYERKNLYIEMSRINTILFYNAGSENVSK